MTFVVADRVKDSTTTTGTGTVTLSGSAPSGFQSFGSVMANGDTCYYVIAAGSEWEVGLGTYSTSGPTLARTIVLASSNSNAAVSFSAGTKDVWLDAPGRMLGDLRSGAFGDMGTLVMPSGDLGSKYIYAGGPGWSGWATANLSSSVANSTNKMYACPFVVPRDMTVDALGITVRTAADASSGSNAVLALYADNDGPSSLIQDAGVVSLESTGAKAATFTAIALRRGQRVWAALSAVVNGSSNPGFGAANAGRATWYTRADLNENTWDGYYPLASYTYTGSAPSTFPTISGGTSGNPGRILIGLRVASLS